MGLVRFETLPDFNDGDYGFDDTDPRSTWQMVPLGGPKYLRLKVVGTTVASIESDNPGIASVTSAEKEIGYKSVYRFDGKAKGPASIYVRGSQREVLARLQIEVKSLRNPFVQFFLVSDKTDDNHHDEGRLDMDGDCQQNDLFAPDQRHFHIEICSGR